MSVRARCVSVVLGRWSRRLGACSKLQLAVQVAYWLALGTALAPHFVSHTSPTPTPTHPRRPGFRARQRDHQVWREHQVREQRRLPPQRGVRRGCRASECELCVNVCDAMVPRPHPKVFSYSSSNSNHLTSRKQASAAHATSLNRVCRGSHTFPSRFLHVAGGCEC